MRVCDLSTGAGHLMRAWRKLREKWADTKTHWNDPVSHQFEERYLRPLGPGVQGALTAIQRLAAVLEQAEKACEDEDRSG